MTTTRVEITQFDGKIDFNSWKKKMKALLSHNKVAIALEKDVTKWSEEKLKKKAELEEEAYNLIIMNLSDAVLRKVDGIETPTAVWGKLESLYALQSAPNLAYLKGVLFAYKMDSSRTIDENIDEFLKLTQVLKGTDQELGDSSLAMILLNSLTEDYQVVKNALQYTGTVPSVDLIVSGLKARELEIKVQRRTGSNLFVKGKGDFNQISNSVQSDSGPRNKKKGKQNHKAKGETRKCFFCNKAGHLKKNCYAWLKKQKQFQEKKFNLNYRNQSK